MPGETAVKIRQKYLLKGSFLVKLLASSLMFKKLTKIMHESSYKFASVIDSVDHFQNRFNLCANSKHFLSNIVLIII